MKNIEKYGNNIMNEYDGSIACGVRRLKGHNECAGIKCIDCNMDALKWLIAECKGLVLDDKEREYLSYGIRPFREKIECIYKHQMTYRDEYYIIVMLKDGDSLMYPRFKGNTMYNGMEVEKEYTLEELGL